MLFIFAVFTVPMRNWNHPIILPASSLTICFYSTYEELKHRDRIAVKQKIDRFYSTYEELKQLYLHIRTRIKKRFYSTYEELKRSKSIPSPQCKLCFYSTYEELKLQNPRVPISVMQVFTVPMRNWNIKPICWNPPSSFVFTVPMRNWNFCYISSFHTRIRRFYSTYEELKLRLEAFFPMPLLSFYSTYEELKLGCPMSSDNSSKCFYSTYEELKHYSNIS